MGCGKQLRKGFYLFPLPPPGKSLEKQQNKKPPENWISLTFKTELHISESENEDAAFSYEDCDSFMLRKNIFLG